MNFEDELEKLQQRVVIMDERPRILGMFRSWTTQPRIYDQYKSWLPRVGFGDHVQTCKECAASGEAFHPKLHAIFMYVRIGLTLHTVSWPTWLSDIFS